MLGINGDIKTLLDLLLDLLGLFVRLVYRSTGFPKERR